LYGVCICMSELEKKVDEKIKEAVVYEKVGNRVRGFDVAKFTRGSKVNYQLRKSYYDKESSNWVDYSVSVFPSEVDALVEVVAMMKEDNSK